MTRQVRIATLMLPAIRSISMVSSSTQLDAEKARRANRERLCWQIQDLDGAPLGVGLFEGPEHAAQFCRELGWRPGGFPDRKAEG